MNYPRRFPHRLFVITPILGLLGLTACSTVYYQTMGALGLQKRDILIDRVKDARNDQTEAKEQFESALDHFMSVVDVQGGELERTYRELKAEYDQSKSKAQAVRDRIASVQSVAEDLFDEWESELDRYNSDDLRRASARKLDKTRKRYEKFIEVMQDAASKMDPVLQAFQDQVLFLKHNLNARAFASLEGEAAKLQTNVKQLVREMEASIDEADAFIAEMGQGG